MKYFNINDFESKSKKIEMILNFEKNGYIVYDLNINNSTLDAIINEMKSLNQDEAKKNPKIFHYNESPRIIELWRDSTNCKSLALNPLINKFCNLIFLNNAIPFSTINFFKSSEQPMHSDAVHFASLPKGLLIGAWVALEDINPDSGPLAVVPKSHLLDEFYLDSYNLKIPTNNTKLKENYTQYETYISEKIKIQNLEIIELPISKGQCIIWHSNLLHGANKAKNFELTRFSQVTHYHIEGAQIYYNPLYSLHSEQKFAERDISLSRIK